MAEQLSELLKTSLNLGNGTGTLQHSQLVGSSTNDTTTSTAPLRQHTVAGGGQAMQALRELIGWPRLYAKEAAELGVVWPKGLLLHGPPGCGKTLMVQAVAEEFNASLHTVTAGDVYGAYMGQSERQLREAFEAAEKDVEQGKTTVVFLDEVDALCPRRDKQRTHESRVVAQLLTLLDGANSRTSVQSQSTQAGTIPTRQPSSQPGHLVVVGATNRPGALDPALRRPGRLDREVAVNTPDAQQRLAILQTHLAGLQMHPAVDLPAIAASCHGYSGADLAALAREAALMALSEAASQLLENPNSQSSTVSDPAAAESVVVTTQHFAAAMRHVGPSIVRGSEAEVPDTKWEDIGGLPDVKRRLRQCVEWPLQHRASFQRLGLTPPRGVLLYGPPGCSKTTLVRAAASQSGATLLPLSCAQLYSMYVGEGEALLRDIFRRARLAAPAIILLDEVDAVAARRAEGGEAHGGEAGVRLLTTLLTEMDGVEEITGVLVLGATNRPHAVDSALLRPGRFDALLYVPPPDLEGRIQILQIHTRKMPLAEDVNINQLAADTNGWTGAELAGLCREAALAALRDDLEGATCVAARHFEAARAASRAPATSPLTLAALENWAGNRKARTAASTA